MTETPPQHTTGQKAAESTESTGSGEAPGHRLFTDPWVQAGLAGAAMLVPARRYPRWAWQTLTWGSTAVTVAVALVPGATTRLLEFSARHLGPEGQEQELVEVPEPGPVFRATAALGAGAAMYGSWRFSHWIDGAAERGLRRLRVPAPRLAMAAGMAAVTWYQVDRENRRNQ